MRKFVMAALVVIVIGIAGYRVMTHGEDISVKSIDRYQEELGLPVVVQPAERSRLAVSRQFAGTVEGVKQADVVANTAKELIGLPVTVGSYVKKHQVVAELDADAASSGSLRYGKTLAAFKEAQKNLERMKYLFEAGAASEQTYDQAQLAYENARVDYEAMRKLVKIEAPISGIVTHIFYRVGETVKNGAPLVRIAQLNTVRIEITINETEIAGIKNGQNAVVSVAPYPNQTFEGTLERLSLSADPVSRAFTAWVRVPNQDMRLRPGMFAKVAVMITSKDDALLISKDAVLSKQDTTWVYVVQDDNIARRRDIYLGSSSGNLVEVVSNLEEGEQVVIEGHNKLRDGITVNIIETRRPQPPISPIKG